MFLKIYQNTLCDRRCYVQSKDNNLYRPVQPYHSTQICCDRTLLPTDNKTNDDKSITEMLRGCHIHTLLNLKKGNVTERFASKYMI